jgi:hypothetical protein
MLIEVIRSDFTEGTVQDYLLEAMIQSGKIAAFRRSGGWVVVGSHPIREHKPKYSGPDRREPAERRGPCEKRRVKKGVSARANVSAKKNDS